jgi:hypothetical protein
MTKLQIPTNIGLRGSFWIWSLGFGGLIGIWQLGAWDLAIYQ